MSPKIGARWQGASFGLGPASSAETEKVSARGGAARPRHEVPAAARAQSLPRFEFYERARGAFAVVLTSEARPYGCFLLTIGVVSSALGRLYGRSRLRYGSTVVWFRVDLRVRADADDDVLHEIAVLANTYAIVDEVKADRDAASGDPRFTARIDAPNAQSAIGALLTVIGQTSGHPGLTEAGAVRSIAVERDELAGEPR